MANGPEPTFYRTRRAGRVRVWWRSARSLILSVQAPCSRRFAPGSGRSFGNTASTRRGGQSMALDKQALIDGLNSDLAGEYAAIIQYTHYAATVTGPFRESLRTMFMAEVPDEQRHAQYLAAQIAFLGGTPTTVPRPVPAAETPKEMLRRILEAEERAVQDYNERIRQAEAYGDTGLKVALENQVSDETNHKQEVSRMLAGWPD